MKDRMWSALFKTLTTKKEDFERIVAVKACTAWIRSFGQNTNIDEELQIIKNVLDILIGSANYYEMFYACTD